MPKMKKVAEMSEMRVFHQLQRLENSIYRGVPVENIKTLIGGYNNACRYLNELILVNDLNRSDLHQVSEQNSSKERSRGTLYRNF